VKRQTGPVKKTPATQKTTTLVKQRTGFEKNNQSFYPTDKMILIEVDLNHAP
jgi:hypothetical protein